MKASHKAKSTNRRRVLAGSAAIVGLFALPTKVFAGFTDEQRNPPAGNYSCESVHDQMANELDRVIADPKFDGERTALTLMEARCPDCGQRVDPKTSSISAVIPQWKTPDKFVGKMIARSVR